MKFRISLTAFSQLSKSQVVLTRNKALFSHFHDNTEFITKHMIANIEIKFYIHKNPVWRDWNLFEFATYAEFFSFVSINYYTVTRTMALQSNPWISNSPMCGATHWHVSLCISCVTWWKKNSLQVYAIPGRKTHFHWCDTCTHLSIFWEYHFEMNSTKWNLFNEMPIQVTAYFEVSLHIPIGNFIFWWFCAQNFSLAYDR